MDFEAPASDLAAAQVAAPAAPAKTDGGFEAPEADAQTASVESAATDDHFDPVDFYRKNGKTPEALDFASSVAHTRAQQPVDKLKATGGLAKGIYDELGNTAGDIKDAFTGQLGEAKSGLGGFVQGVGVAAFKAGKSIVTSPKAAQNFETSNAYLKRMHEKISKYDTLLEQEAADRAQFVKDGGKLEDYVSPISDEDRVSPEDRAEYDNTAADQYEMAAALRKGSLHGGELALKAGRAIKGLFNGGEKALSPEDWKERIATDADIHDTADNLSQAAGMTNKGAAGFFAAKPDLPDSERARLLKQGTINAPEINQMAVVGDPTNLALGEALRLPGVSKAVGGALRLSGSGAKYVGSVADRVIGHGAGRAIAGGVGAVGVYEAGKHALRGDMRPLGLGLALFAARGLLRRGGGLVDDAGRELLDPEGFNSASATKAAGALAEDAASNAPQAETAAGTALGNFTSPTQNAAAANRIARRTIQGVGMGVAGAVPFVATADNAQEAGHSLAGGGVFGAVLGPMGGVEGTLDRAMEINKAATTMLADRGGQQTFSDPNLQRAHNAGMADLPTGISTYLNALRGLVSGFKGRNGQPMKMAVLNEPDFQAQVATRYGMTTEEAADVKSHGFYDAKTGTIFINKGNLRVDSAGHETGHFITDEVMQQVGRGYGDALKQATEEGLFNGDKPTPEFQKFIESYNKALPEGAAPIPTDKGRADILANRAVSEYLSETARNILGEPYVGKFMLPKDVSDRISEKMADMYGNETGGKKDVFNRTDLPTIHEALKNVIFDLGRGMRPDPSLAGRRRPAPTEPATPSEGAAPDSGAAGAEGAVSGDSGSNPGMAENPYEDVGLTPEVVEGAKDHEMNMLPVKTKGSGMTATRIVRQREADWNEHLDKYLEYLRTNGLSVPNNPLELHHRVTDFALRSEPEQKYNVIDPNEGHPLREETGGALAPETGSSYDTKSEETKGALAEEEKPAERGGVMTEQEVTDRVSDAEAKAKADPGFTRKKTSGQAAAVREARINALLDASHEAAQGDTDFLQRRTDAGGRVTYRGRLAPDEVPAHRLLLDELGMSPDGQATIDLLNDHVGQTVYLDYKSAVKSDPSDITGKQRKEEYAESTPEDRKAGGAHTEQKGKAFFITGFKVWPKAGSITLTGFSPDKWLANAHKLIEHVNKMGLETGYKGVNDPDLALDMQGYTANHTNGYKGDGSAPVEGRTPTPGYQPYEIPQDRFQVLNAALNLDVSTKADSKRPGVREGAMEAQYRALDNGVPVDEETGDTNPLRAYINKHGNLVSMNDAKGEERVGTGDHLESVYENISPDLVTGLSTTPDGQKIVRPVGFKGDPADITQGGIPRGDYAASGFMPDSSSSYDTKSKDAEDLINTLRAQTADVMDRMKQAKDGAALADSSWMDPAFHFNTLASRAVMELQNAMPDHPNIAKGFDIWRDAMADVAASLPDVGERKSFKTQRKEDPFTGMKTAFPGGKEMDLADAVKKAHDLAIGMMKGGPEKKAYRLTGVHRDYLNMLEIIQQLDPKAVSEDAIRDLTESTYGSRKTNAETLEDFKDEMTGASMLGEVDKAEGKGVDMYRSKEGALMPDSGAADKEVDKAAKAAGYNIKVAHSTNAETFNEFKTGALRAHFGSEAAALDRAKHLKEFSENVVGRKHNEPRVMPLYLKMESPLRLPDLADLHPDERGNIVDQSEAHSAWKEKWDNLTDEEKQEYEEGNDTEGIGDEPRPMAWESDTDFAEVLHDRGIISRDEFWDVQYDKDKAVQLLKEKGYDGIVYKNHVEGGGEDSYIAFDPEQIKSAEQITKDDSGKEIPTAERFDASKKDIRFMPDSGEENKDYETYFPRIKSGDEVDGRTVRDRVPNLGSIEASGMESLPGIREIPMRHFNAKPTSLFYDVRDIKTVDRLADEIGESGEINPLIVGIDAEGPYILEGAHRLGALYKLGAKSFPAVVALEPEAKMPEGSFMPDSGKGALSSYGTKSDVDALGFYSGLARVIADKIPNRASGEQIMATLKGAGAKQEEMENMGLPEFLKTHEGPVTKQALQDFVKAGGVQLKEVTKSGETWSAQHDAAQAAFEKVGLDFSVSDDGGVYLRDNDGNEKEYADMNKRQKAVYDKFNPSVGNPPKYGRESLRLPGGENYKEVLLTLPESKSARDKISEQWEAYEKQLREKYHEENASRLYDKLSPSERAKYEDFEARFTSIKGEPLHHERNFQSKHWDEYNVLAHIRQADHKDAEGNKVRLIEEIQSDWHQKGREDGYQGKEEESRRAALRNKPGSLTDTEMEELGNLNGNHLSSVPDAPFKKTWAELAFKRALGMAVKDGMDKIAWTPGDEQAKRYDLSNQVDSVRAEPRQMGGYDVTAIKDGEKVIEKHAKDDKELADLVGKELAQKISEQTADDGEPVEFSGLDLKVGGGGMKGFYDKILPDFVRKYVKKWGGKVETTELSGGSPEFEGFRKWFIQEHGQSYAGENGRKQLVKMWEDYRAGGDSRKVDDYLDSMDKKTVHSVTITPEMRKAILEEGQPMFMPDSGSKGALAGEQESRESASSHDTKMADKPEETKSEKNGFPVFQSNARPAIMSENGDGVIGQGYFMPSAFHGTPHEFDKFSMDKLGSGEGAQAFGWGLYFAENRKVADDYRKRLSDYNAPGEYEYNGEVYPSTDYKDPVRHAVALAFHQGKSTAIQIAKQGLRDSKAGEPYALESGGEDYYNKMLDAAKGIKSVKQIKFKQGHVYSVDLDVSDADLLHYDKPLSEQADAVKDLVRDMLKKEKFLGANDDGPRQLDSAWKAFRMERASMSTGDTGEGIYDAIAKDKGGEKEASLFLNENGIHGIKYADEGSRTKRSGKTFNYVIFDDSKITVKDRNGRPVNLHDAAPGQASDAPGPFMPNAEEDGGFHVYHGTPHRIVGPFDLSKIGTGEGAQAFGHGLYFAENKDVAISYWPRESGMEDKLMRKYKAAEGREDYDEMELWEAAMLHELPDSIRSGESYAHVDSAKRERVAKQLGQILQSAKGGIYKVHMDVKPEELLDWDKPLAEQSDAVKQSLRKALESDGWQNFLKAVDAHDAGDEKAMKSAGYGIFDYPGTAGGIYQTLSTEMGPAKASALLAKHGIPGIKFLDQHSRAGTPTDEATTNFVIFDTSRLKVIGRNGKLESPKAGEKFMPDSGGALGGKVESAKPASSYDTKKDDEVPKAAKNTVTVTKDGESIEIPKSNLKKALKKGWTRA